MRNKIYLLALLLLLMNLPSWAQIGGDYNPDNPGDPGNPVLRRNLTLIAEPTSGGSFNAATASVLVGENYNLRAYPASDFVFVAWVCEGDTISKSASYNIVMPDRDLVITGVFRYDPNSPGDPDQQALKYQLSLVAEPMNSGSFNFSNERIAVGATTSIKAYTSTDYVFKHWRIGDSILSTSQNYDFTMPAHPVTIIGQFEYNPGNPPNPNANYWDPVLGHAIVDDFTPGSLASALSSLLNRHNANKNAVQMITVSGQMNDNDFGIANDYTRCILLDLSRVTGVTTVPSYAFDYTNLENVYLPATIEAIGERAFYQCTKLGALTIYAMTPPQLGSNVFYGVPEGLVVYVPAAAIPLYQNDPNWGAFTILPIVEDLRTLTVNLPANANPADYANMWLELRNTKNGQRMHYVMTDKKSYNFNNIICNTTWDVVLCSPEGHEFGKIENVEVKDDNVTVTFSSLSKPYSINLSVLTPNGQNVTSQVEITWIDTEGYFISNEPQVKGLPLGYRLTYRLTLPQELAIAYNQPPVTEYTVTSGTNSIVCHLQALARLTVSGKVKDASTGQPLYDANVTASQTFGDKYDVTVSTKTERDGSFSLEIAKVPTVVGAASSEYITKTVECDVIAGGALVLPDIMLEPITGAAISVGMTYTPAHVEGEEVETQNWYEEYNNVDFALYNVTTNHAIEEYSVQLPRIVLLEDVNDGDVIKLTATSRKGDFMPVETTVTINEQKANADFNIIELGQIAATFSQNNNMSVVGILYDGNGKFVSNNNYNDASSLTLTGLQDGNYTLVTMGDSRFLSTIYDLAQLSAAGLKNNQDYVQNSVVVRSGIISNVAIANVPTLDESKFYYTGENTSFTANKSSIVIGNYLTMTGRVDFKPVYATAVSNVQMIVDLPESCSFVEKSVMVGNSISGYQMDGNRIIIPMAQYADRVRFCVVPTVGGDFAPSAFAQFDIDGETITQPIGSACFKADELSITVPTVAAKTSIPVHGKAIGKCSVNIYDNNILIGQTTSLANGFWFTNVELNEPYNMTMHTIHAQVTTANGLLLNTETQKCQYFRNAIEVSTVTMINTAHPASSLQLCEYVTVFDYMHPEKAPQPYWYWPSYPDFTFLVDLTNNDTTIVSSVDIYVFTDHNHVVKLPAHYDAINDKWVATSKFGTSDLPINVSVDFIAKSVDPYPDYAQIEDIYKNDFSLRPDFELIDERLEHYVEQLDLLYSSGASDYSAIDELHREFCVSINVDWLTDDQLADSLASLNAEQLNAYKEALLNEINGIEYDAFIDYYDSKSDLLDKFSYECEVDGKHYLICKNTCDSLVGIDLVGQGYQLLLTTDGDAIYIKGDGSCYEFVDFRANVYNRIQIIDESANNHSRRAANAQYMKAMETINRYNTILTQCFNALLSMVQSAEDFCDEKISSISAEAKKLSELSRREYEIGNFSEAAKHDKATFELFAKESKYKKFISGKGVKVFSCLAKVVDLLGNLATLATDVKKWKDLQEKIDSKVNSCKDNKTKAKELSEDVSYYGGLICTGDVIMFGGSVYGIAMMVAGIAGAAPTGGAFTVISGGAGMACTALSIAAGFTFTWMSNRNYERLVQEVDNLKCQDDDNNNDNKNNVPDPKTPPTSAVLDPSGFVYEGVLSNRLQGVTTTCYYKEAVEDMYGDLHDEIILWDASQYGQENPLFTDENGFYGWDVPVGLWQVKYEKAGYETVYSEWLPVPPPQLDINIAMTQMRQPEVIKARAYPVAVELEFDKYMKPETLHNYNIYVTANGAKVDGSIKLLNEEESANGEATYASRVRFNALSPFNSTEVTLHVSHLVESYAGLKMSDDYEQTLTVEPEIVKIEADSTIYVAFGENRQLTVSVLPGIASKGKTLNVRSSSPAIATTDAEVYTLDNNGQVKITVQGNLPGLASLLFGVDGYELSAATLVNVIMESEMLVATPTASIASGSEVKKGTEVYLYCATEGATIYYTLDGSCPCDNTEGRMVYDGSPIIINNSVTIKAMAVAEGMYDSEVATFTYRVKGGLKGDVNGDGTVNIADINKLIDYILRDLINSETLERGDVNGDNTINIADINAVIQIILGPAPGAKAAVNTADVLHMNDLMLQPGETGTLSVTVDNAERYSAMQCDIVLPDGLTLVNSSAMGAYVLETGTVGDNTSRAITYSMNLRPFADDSQSVLTLTVRADAALTDMSQVVLTDVVLADVAGKAWYANDCFALVNNASGVKDLYGYDRQIANIRYYNVAGQEISYPEGLTIQVTTYTDGTRSATRIVK